MTSGGVLGQGEVVRRPDERRALRDGRFIHAVGSCSSSRGDF